MLTVKKAKLEKVIKSIDRKRDLLTLGCEWAECNYVCKDTDSFLVHISHHIDELLIQETATDSTKDAVLECCWRDCGHEQNFQTFMELQRHVYFHGFHTRLKSIGSSLSSKNALPACQFDSSNRNNLPELPDQLRCCWDCCDNVFDIPDIYYSHVSQHANLYPSGNTPDGGCACLWAGCTAVVRSKHRLKEHLRSHTQEKTMACTTCGSLFANATKMFDHIQRQNFSDTHRYECSHCNKTCATERLLRDHMRQHVNHYRCPYCEKTCPNPSSLRVHVHYRHTEDRPYKCYSCNYWAKTPVDLRRHMNTHSQMKIACEVPDCTFHARYYWEMNLHCHIAHEGSESYKYMCHLCNSQFGKGNRLTKHLRLKHHYALPSGHKRFRYRKEKDGYYRLLTVRYESMDMKERVVPPLTARSMSLKCSLTQTTPEVTSSSVVFDVKESTTGYVPMSNLELLGDVAFAMSHPDGTVDCSGQIANTADVLANDDTPIPDSHVIFNIPNCNDTPQSNATVLQRTVEIIDSNNMAGSDSTRSLSGTSSSSCVYLTVLSDSYDASRDTAPPQYCVRSVVNTTEEHYDDNVASAGSYVLDELNGYQPSTARGDTVGTVDSGYVNTVDVPLDPFSASLITNVATS